MKNVVLGILGGIGLVTAGRLLYYKGRKDQLDETSKEIQKINEEYIGKQAKKPGRPRKNTSENNSDKKKSE